MVTLDWAQSFRIIHSRYPFVGIFDRIADPRDLDLLAPLERRTNPRVLDEAGAIALVRPEDRIVGPGTTPIMAAFTHTRPNRFSDGSFGTYYAARQLGTAVAESRFHVELFYRATDEVSADIDMRAYSARIAGRFDDLTSIGPEDPRLDPNSYVASQRYGVRVYEENLVDGILYRSVRDREHRPAVACLRPRVVSSCYSYGYLLYRWDGTAQRIVDVLSRETFAGG
ncbi:MAG: RES family NAD+ phosphorylase [Candidatus Cybelea sp.]